MLSCISIVANTLSAFAGGGAGLFQLPALILLGLPFSIALATHKFASFALGIGAGSRHWGNSSLNPVISSIILIAGLPGVWLGSNIILSIPEKITTIILGLLTIALGVYSTYSPNLGVSERLKILKTEKILIGGIVLFIIGFLNGSLSSGTGLFVTIWLVSWFGLSYSKAVAHTLILVGLVWNGIGALILGVIGDIRWDWIPGLLIGAIIGGYFGAHISIAKGSKSVKIAYQWLSIIMGVSLLISYI